MQVHPRAQKLRGNWQGPVRPGGWQGAGAAEPVTLAGEAGGDLAVFAGHGSHCGVGG